ncbi:MAG: hypothetical protein QXR71_04475 [Candidatus Aenigmatarchaeota archaeon]
MDKLNNNLNGFTTLNTEETKEEIAIEKEKEIAKEEKGKRKEEREERDEEMENIQNLLLKANEMSTKEIAEKLASIIKRDRIRKVFLEIFELCIDDNKKKEFSDYMSRLLPSFVGTIQMFIYSQSIRGNIKSVFNLISNPEITTEEDLKRNSCIVWFYMYFFEETLNDAITKEEEEI